MGATGFGGGFAILGNIRRVVVRQKRWMTEHEFLDAVSLAQSLPGANAANAITYIGLKLAGLKGALVSVVSFLVPSFIVMLGLSIAHGYLVVFPDARRVFQGFSAAVVGLIAANTVRLGKTAVQKQWHLELGVAVGFLLIFTETTIAEVVLLSGLIGVFIHSFKTRARRRVRKKLRNRKAETEPETETATETETAVTNEARTEVTAPAEVTGERRLLSFAAPILLFLVALPFLEQFVIIWRLITIFLRIGTVTFGGGYVMVPQIEADVVEVHQWLTHAEFADDGSVLCVRVRLSRAGQNRHAHSRSWCRRRSSSFAQRNGRRHRRPSNESAFCARATRRYRAQRHSAKRQGHRVVHGRLDQ